MKLSTQGEDRVWGVTIVPSSKTERDGTTWLDCEIKVVKWKAYVWVIWQEVKKRFRL